MNHQKQAIQWLKTTCPDINQVPTSTIYKRYCDYFGVAAVSLYRFSQMLNRQGVRRTNMRYQGRITKRYNTAGNSRLAYIPVVIKSPCDHCNGTGFLNIN